MTNRATGDDDGITTLDHALERICFLQWRLEQLEASLQDARLKNQSLRGQLTEITHEQVRDGARQVSLTDQLAEARSEVQSMEERLALSERARASAEAHTRELEAQLLTRARTLSATAERERQRSEVLSRTLADVRARADGLERAHARFFLRMQEWQRLLGSDPDRIDLAEFIAELRADVVRLSGERELSLRREQRLRLALVEVGARLPKDTELETELPTPAARAPVASAAAVAAIAGAQQLIESLAEAPRAPTPEAPLTPQPTAAPKPPPTAPIGPAADLREALKARMGQLSPADALSAFSHLSPARQAAAQPLLLEVARASVDRALAAAHALTREDPEAATPAVLARLRQDGAHTEAWLGALAHCRGPLAISAVQPYLQADDWRVRAAATDTLLALAPESQTRAILDHALGDRDDRVRRRAALATQARLGRGAEALLHPLLDDPSAGTRRLVTTLLRGRRPATVSAVVSPTRRTPPWST